jgi:hypothetical protein
MNKQNNYAAYLLNVGRKNNPTPGVIHFEKQADKWGDFPLIGQHPEGVNKAYACNLTVFKNIAAGHAQILTYEFTAKSLFTLKCHFHSNDKKFTYRSDKYPGDYIFQFERMLNLAEKNIKLAYSMQLYDNRRTKKDSLLISWKNGLITYENEFLPYKPKPTEAAVNRANVLAKIFFPLPYKK